MEPDKRFAREHSDKAAKQFMVLMLTKEYRICLMSVNLHGIVPSVELKGELSLLDSHSAFQFDIIRLFHCDGLLLLCTSSDESRIVVWNPCTGETKWIRTCVFLGQNLELVLGYYYQDKKSCNKSYRILSRYIFSSQDLVIYDFDSDSWRVLDYDVAPGWKTTIPSSGGGVSLKGNIYWFATNVTQGISLLKFDFSTEKSECVPLPYQCDGYHTANISVVRGEKLSVLLQRDYTSKTEIWMTKKIDEESTNAVSWCKVLALDLSRDLQISHAGSFLLDEEKKVLVWCERWLRCPDYSRDMVYIVGEDNKVTEVTLGAGTYDLPWPSILNYVPSLAQIQSD